MKFCIESVICPFSDHKFESTQYADERDFSTYQKSSYTGTLKSKTTAVPKEKK